MIVQETKLNPLIYGKLDQDVVEQCEKALRAITELKELFSRPVGIQELYETSEKLLNFRGYLTKYLFEAEARYRYEVKRIQDEDEKKSVARAEAEAKTTDEYREWRYLERIDKLADEQVRLVKKFTTRMEEEWIANKWETKEVLKSIGLFVRGAIKKPIALRVKLLEIMRELRFRAWDKEKKIMGIFPNLYIGMKGELLVNIGDHQFRDVGKQYIIQQFTGLHDRNGKEIYEGDMVKYSVENDEFVGEIHFASLQFRIGKLYPTDRLMGWHKTFEIIGNIYEHPELLKWKPHDLLKQK